uniref:Receptor expression-enhancing protein n=1 Tax=Globodera pallida TaxID=36090 RepID=A0A183BLL2_GLOPA
MSDEPTEQRTDEPTEQKMDQPAETNADEPTAQKTEEPTTESDQPAAVVEIVAEVEPPVVVAENVAEAEPPVVVAETVAEAEPPVVVAETVAEAEPPVVVAETIAEVEPPVVVVETVNEEQPPVPGDGARLQKRPVPINNLLDVIPVVRKTLTKCKPIRRLEELTGIDREMGFYGFCGLVAFLLMCCPGNELLSNFIGVSYPTERTFNAVYKQTTTENTQWLVYWCCFALFCLLDSILAPFPVLFSLYMLLKTIILLYMMLPQTYGAHNFYVSYGDSLVTLVANHVSYVDSLVTLVVNRIVM